MAYCVTGQETYSVSISLCVSLKHTQHKHTNMYPQVSFHNYPVTSLYQIELRFQSTLAQMESSNLPKSPKSQTRLLTVVTKPHLLHLH